MRDPQFMARVQRVQEAASGRWLDILIGAGAVSYTHLDVYKRQVFHEEE